MIIHPDSPQANFSSVARAASPTLALELPRCFATQAACFAPDGPVRPRSPQCDTLLNRSVSQALRDTLSLCRPMGLHHELLQISHPVGCHAVLPGARTPTRLGLQLTETLRPTVQIPLSFRPGRAECIFGLFLQVLLGYVQVEKAAKAPALNPMSILPPFALRSASSGWRCFYNAFG